MSETPPTREILLERVRSMLPLLAAEANESENLRRPTDRTIECIEQSGVLRTLLPQCFGGYELDIDTFCEVGMLLGEADTSLAWVATFYIEHNWLFCHLSESFSRSLFAKQGPLLAPAALYGKSSIQRVDGGFELSGRWSWASGSAHASWVMVGGDAGSEDAPDPRFFALPRNAVEIDDVWHVAGMRATGSNDIVIARAIVPEEQTVSLVDLAAGSGKGRELSDAPILRTPMAPLLLMAASTPAIGQARAVVRRFVEKMLDRVRVMESQSEQSRTSIKIRIAEIEAELRDAELRIRDVAADVIQLREEATMLDRARWVVGITRSVHQARDIIQRVAALSGGSAQFDHDPLQRALRDANTAISHAAFDWDARHELYGRVRVGLPPDGFML